MSNIVVDFPSFPIQIKVIFIIALYIYYYYNYNLFSVDDLKKIQTKTKFESTNPHSLIIIFDNVYIVLLMCC